MDQSTWEQMAELVRLHLTETEKEEYTRHLSYILAQVDKIKQVDTSKVAPTTYVLPVQNHHRPDQVASHLSPDQALANAGDTQDNYFKVPRII